MAGETPRSFLKDATERLTLLFESGIRPRMKHQITAVIMKVADKNNDTWASMLPEVFVSVRIRPEILRNDPRTDTT
jgi:hypothetical protein